MGWLKYGYALSFAAHVVAYVAMDKVKEPKPQTEKVAVMMAQKKKKPKLDPEPPKPIEAPRESLRRPLARAAAPAPVPEAAPDPAANAHSSMAGLPDLGISMSGGSLSGGGGIAVPTGPGQPRAVASTPRKEKIFSANAKPAADTSDEGEFVKAKLDSGSYVKPVYSDDARAAGIEGKVRLQISIDATGNVTDAKILTGLGHGLDEAALAAVKRWKFSPATRGGLAVESTFTATISFHLGD